jgi:hypothetical protein
VAAETDCVLDLGQTRKGIFLPSKRENDDQYPLPFGSTVSVAHYFPGYFPPDGGKQDPNHFPQYIFRKIVSPRTDFLLAFLSFILYFVLYILYIDSLYF